MQDIQRLNQAEKDDRYWAIRITQGGLKLIGGDSWRYGVYLNWLNDPSAGHYLVCKAGGSGDVFGVIPYKLLDPGTTEFLEDVYGAEGEKAHFYVLASPYAKPNALPPINEIYGYTSWPMTVSWTNDGTGTITINFVRI